MGVWRVVKRRRALFGTRAGERAAVVRRWRRRARAAVRRVRLEAATPLRRRDGDCNEAAGRKGDAPSAPMVAAPMADVMWS